MKAIIQQRYGGPDVLELADLEPPQPTGWLKRNSAWVPLCCL